jgi:hypothetical protein
VCECRAAVVALCNRQAPYLRRTSLRDKNEALERMAAVVANEREEVFAHLERLKLRMANKEIKVKR